MKPLYWTTTPPNDTGTYWYRCDKGHALARVHWAIDTELKIGAAKSILSAELTIRDYQDRFVEAINAPVAELAQREGAQWSDERIMPPLNPGQETIE